MRFHVGQTVEVYARDTGARLCLGTVLAAGERRIRVDLGCDGINRGAALSGLFDAVTGRACHRFSNEAVRPQQTGAEPACETCGGTGEIDQRLGGYCDSGVVPCPDCDGQGHCDVESKTAGSHPNGLGGGEA